MESFCNSAEAIGMKDLKESQSIISRSDFMASKIDLSFYNSLLIVLNHNVRMSFLMKIT